MTDHYITVWIYSTLLQTHEEHVMTVTRAIDIPRGIHFFSFLFPTVCAIQNYGKLVFYGTNGCQRTRKRQLDEFLSFFVVLKLVTEMSLDLAEISPLDDVKRIAYRNM